MADYPRYTKREFLKILGLGIAFLPIMGCFETRRPEEKEANKIPEQPDTTTKTTISISDDDVQLLLRNDEAYAAYNQGFNKRLRFLPKYMAVCFTEKGVQYAVNKARAEGLLIAVKSGGHSFEGFSSNNGGMVINLSQMKKVTWLSDTEILVQPGALLQELHTALFPKNKLLPSGSCGTVAIAGLTLGGGYGFFSRKHGLTCDSLLQVRMVGADGDIYDSDKDPNLLWACRGGGNGNFGVITSFRFKVYEAPKTFSSLTLKFRKLDASRFTTLLQQWFALTATIDPEAFSAFVLNGTTLTVLATTYQNTPKLLTDFQALTETADSVSQQLDQALATSMKRYYGRKGPI